MGESRGTTHGEISIWKVSWNKGGLVSLIKFSAFLLLFPPLVSTFRLMGRADVADSRLKGANPGSWYCFLALPKPFLISGHDLKSEVPLSSSKYGM